MPIIRFAPAIAAAFLLSACATILGDDDDITLVRAEPASARCDLAGKDYKWMTDGPERLAIPKAAAPVTLTCRAEGYFATVAKLDVGLDSRFFSNLAFGNSLGAVVGMMSGAAMKYPELVVVVLEPKSFAGRSERDVWYDRRRLALAKRWDRTMEMLRIDCEDGTETPIECIDRLKSVRSGWDTDLRRLKARRLRARIRTDQEARNTAPDAGAAPWILPLSGH